MPQGRQTELQECAERREVKAEGASLVSRLFGIGRCFDRESRGFSQPRGRSFWRLKNLKVGNGCIAGIHLMALGEKGLREIVAPGGLRAFDLDQGHPQGLAAGIGLAPLEGVRSVKHALFNFLFVAGIAAQEKIVQVEAIVHDLVADGFDGADALQRRALTPAAIKFTKNNRVSTPRIIPKPT